MYLDFDVTKPGDVVAFGRATIDLYANEIGPLEDAVTLSKYVGGSPANTSVAMARLGLKVGYIGKVSDDPLGRFITSYLSKNSVDVSHIAVAEPGIRSGVTIGEIKTGECNCFMYRKDCADLHIDCGQLDESYIAKHKMLLVSGTSLSHPPAREAVFLALSYARRNRTRVVLDLDYREDTWDSPEEASVYYTLAAENADMVVGTRDEFDVMEYLFDPSNQDNGKSARRLLDKGVSLVSIKQGQKGSFIYTGVIGLHQIHAQFCRRSGRIGHTFHTVLIWSCNMVAPGIDVADHRHSVFMRFFGDSSQLHQLTVLIVSAHDTANRDRVCTHTDRFLYICHLNILLIMINSKGCQL